MKKNIKKQPSTTNFKLLMPFTVKADSEDNEIIKIEGYGNFLGQATEDDYSCCYIDRANEIVIPSGMDVASYKKNPVILFQHDRDDVIGKATSVTKKADGIYIKAEIHAGACEPEVFYAIKNGLIQSFSIGFRTKSGSMKEIGKTMVYVIEKSELFEVSCVSVPCNSESTFQVIKSFNEDGFYAGDIEETPTVSTHTDTNKDAGEDTMKIKLRELLSDDAVKSMESAGLIDDLDALRDVDTKSYIDTKFETVSAQLTELKELITSKLETKEEEIKSEDQPTGDENTKSEEDETPPADEEKAEEIVLDEADLGTIKSLSDEIEKLKAFTA